MSWSFKFRKTGQGMYLQYFIGLIGVVTGSYQLKIIVKIQENSRACRSFFLAELPATRCRFGSLRDFVNCVAQPDDAIKIAAGLHSKRDVVRWIESKDRAAQKTVYQASELRQHRWELFRILFITNFLALISNLQNQNVGFDSGGASLEIRGRFRDRFIVKRRRGRLRYDFVDVYCMQLFEIFA